MSLVTRCPHCDTSFRVTDDQLSAADGMVRCGACLAVFSALEHLVPELQLEEASDDDRALADEQTAPGLAGASAGASQSMSPEDETDHDPGSESCTEDADELKDVDEQTADAGTADADEFDESASACPVPIIDTAEATTESEAALAADQEALEDAGSDSPSTDGVYVDGVSSNERFDGELDLETAVDELIGEYEPPVKRHYLAWTLGCLILLLVLAGQVAWFNRDLLAQNPALRGYYESACSILGCDLPVYRDLDALHVARLAVRTDPAVAHALEVDAIIRNDAPWRQYFPDLRLEFSGISGNLVAERTFKPAEYLAGEMTGVKFIPATTEVRITLEIVDPGQDATNYSLTVVR